MSRNTGAEIKSLTINSRTLASTESPETLIKNLLKLIRPPAPTRDFVSGILTTLEKKTREAKELKDEDGLLTNLATLLQQSKNANHPEYIRRISWITIEILSKTMSSTLREQQAAAIFKLKTIIAPDLIPFLTDRMEDIKTMCSSTTALGQLIDYQRSHISLFTKKATSTRKEVEDLVKSKAADQELFPITIKASFSKTAIA